VRLTSRHTPRSYDGEEGIDAGGVFKDWLGSISRELLKPGALFLPCLSASGASVRCLRLNPLPSEFGVANEAQVLQHSQCSWRHSLCISAAAKVAWNCAGLLRHAQVSTRYLNSAQSVQGEQEGLKYTISYQKV